MNCTSSQNNIHVLSNLRVATYNCNSIRRAAALKNARSLCENNHIILLQETMLPAEEILFLNNIHPDFYFRAISPCSYNNGLMEGRPFGGLAILWHKSLHNYVTIETIPQEYRVMGIRLSFPGKIMDLFLYNVYLPYQCQDNVDEFNYYLGLIASIIEACPSSYVALLGDFNADNQHSFGKLLLDLCNGHNFVLSDVNRLPLSSFTFVSASHNVTSWLDHCLSTPAMDSIINACEIDLSKCTYDHMPMYININLDDVIGNHDADTLSNVNVVSESKPLKKSVRLFWEKASHNDLNNFYNLTDILANDIVLPHDVLTCNDVRCESIEHRETLDKFYQNLCDLLNKAAFNSIPHSSSNSSQFDFRSIPGWNEMVENKHDEARFFFLLWVQFGKPRTGTYADNMRRSRARFKHALKECKRHNDAIKANKLAYKFLQHDRHEFWSAIRSQINRKLPLSTKIENAVEPSSICDLWKAHYKNLLNSVDNDSLPNILHSKLNENPLDSIDRIMPFEILQIINEKIQLGKSAGSDEICAEHLKYASPRISVYLSLFF